MPVTSSPLPPATVVRLRPLRLDHRDEVQAVLGLNEADVALLAPMDLARLREVHRLCHRFDVVEVDGRLGGFVITFRAGSPYDSANYRWFSERYDSFGYLDRVVIDPAVRRRGVASRVYEELEAAATADGRMLLEVNAVPPNVPSLAFHRGRRYAEVGRLGSDQDHHEVALMAKELGSNL